MASSWFTYKLSNGSKILDNPHATQNIPFASLGVQFAGTGTSGAAALSTGTAKTTTIWFTIPYTCYLDGGQYWTVGSIDGDTIQVDVVDKDGILAPAGTVLTTPSYFNTWNLVGADHTVLEFKTPYSANVIQGLYLRFNYTTLKTSGSIPTFYCNLFLHILL